MCTGSREHKFNLHRHENFQTRTSQTTWHFEVSRIGNGTSHQNLLELSDVMRIFVRLLSTRSISSQSSQSPSGGSEFLMCHAGCSQVSSSTRAEADRVTIITEKITNFNLVSPT